MNPATNTPPGGGFPPFWAPALMLRSAITVLVAVAIAVLGGAWSVSTMIAREFEPKPAGLWRPLADPTALDANPYERARMALSGNLTLGRAEGLAFVAREDEAGDTLQADCQYALEGPVPAARFWTLYAGTIGKAGGARPAPRQAGPALHSLQTLRRADGGIAVTVGGGPAPGNWLRVETTGAIELVLTLYDAPSAGGLATGEVALPRVARTGCDA